MQTSIPTRILRVAGSLALLLALATAALGQGVTTSGISGFVTEKDGKPIGSAAVSVTNTATGATAPGVTRSNGQFDISGLPAGGPYSLTVTASGFPAQTQSEIYLEPGQTSEVNFRLTSEIVKMEALTVAGTRDPTFDSNKTGTATTVNSDQISVIPTVRYDIQDIANLDPRVSLTPNTSTGEFSLSAMSQNSRYNSVLIDGMQSNDPFGLNANGSSSTRSPTPLGSIASMSIDFNPIDVTRSGFTGALINVVTKSGTNQFHGSIYTYYTGQRLEGANPGTGSWSQDYYKGQHDALQEHTYGISIGGPIVKDRLFFFLAYEDYEKHAAPTLITPQIFRPDDASIAAVLAATQKWGYDPGQLTGAQTTAKQKSYLARIDWNICNGQRLELLYRRINGDFANPADYNGTTYTSFSNHWYQARRITDNVSVLLNSNWTPNFQTEAGAAYVKYNGTAQPRGQPFPEIYVNGITGTRLDNGAAVTNGQIDLGTNYSYQYNSLFTTDYNGHLYGEYSIGAHTIKFGGDSDKTEYLDKFVQYYFGRYAFANAADFGTGYASYLQYRQASPGFTIDASNADYSLTDFGLALQDTWRPNQQLTVIGGLRFDYPYIPGKPLYLPAFQSTWGFRNDTTGTGNYVVAPRLGFSYTVPAARKVQVRGGIGLFQGTNPAVWIANAFDTNGSLNSVTVGNSTTNVHPATPAATFNANPTFVQTLPPPATGGTPVINVTDPNFRTPAAWKANLAVDYTLPVLDGVIFTAEANVLKVAKAIALKSLNINPVGTLPDGRIRYSGSVHSNFSNVLDLTNTDQGGAQSYTLQLVRPMKNHWAASVSYTHTHATEVQPLTSSVASSSYNYRAAINPNDDVAYRSGYSTPNKLVITGTREFTFVKNARTRISTVFRIQTGHAYSWIFGNDANGDGISGNDAFYIPTPNDARVVWAGTNFSSPAAAQAAFFAFANGTSLKKFGGQIITPFSESNPEQHTLDLKVEQDIPVYGKAKLTLFASCYNFANLFSKRWGIINGLDFGTGFNGYSRNTGVNATYSTTTNLYTYTFNPSNVSAQPNFSALSRWQLQLGARLSF